MKKVVILGGGFGGLSAMAHIRKHIKRKTVQVTLIDKHNFSLFTPMLPEVVSGNVKPDNIVLPLREICVKSGVTFVKDKVMSINPDANMVVCEDGSYEYDYLIVATGSKTNFRGNQSAVDNALTFKTITDAIKVKYLIIETLEKASRIADPELRKKLLSFSVIGGGITGVELATEMNDFIREKIKKEYSTISGDDLCITILEYYKTILPSIDETQAVKAQKIVEKNGLNVINHANVTEVGKDFIKYKIGEEEHTLDSSMTIWTAGVMGRDHLATLKGEQAPDKRLMINHTLMPENVSAENIFVIGDSCAYKHKEHYLPPVAPLAMQQGIMAVINIIRMINGRPKKQFTYFHFGYLVSLGKNYSVINMFGIKMRGRFAYYLWKMIYMYKVGMFRKQVALFFDWIMSSWFGNESILLVEIERDKEPPEKDG